MKKVYFLFLFALIASLGGVQAAEPLLYETGFEESEGFKSSTTYNNGNVKLVGPENQQWGTICGTPSTSDAISGKVSMQLRYYKSVKAAPYAFTNFDLQNVSKVVFKAATNNASNNSLLVQHSTDGGSSWSDGESFTLTTEPQEFTYTLTDDGANVRFKFTANNTPVEKKGIFIDDVKIYGSVQEELIAPVISGVSNGGSYYGSAFVNISYPELATSMTYTITKDGVQEQKTVTSAVENLELNEAGSYKVEATATDGDQTLSAEAVEFTILAIPEGAFVKVTDVDDLQDGDRVIIVCEPRNAAMGSASSGYRNAVSVEIIDNRIIVLPSNTEVSVFTLGVSQDGYSFYDGTGYLSVSGDNTTLATASEAYNFSINIIGGVANIMSNWNRIIRYNFNDGEDRFAHYSATGSQEDVQIYKGPKEEPQIKCADPEFSLAEGTYNDTQSLTITSTEGSTIVYTINDGEEQTAVSPATIELKNTGSAVTYTVTAYATMEGATDSETVTKTYTIDPNAVLPQALIVKISDVANENDWKVSSGNTGETYRSFTTNDFSFNIDATDDNSGKYYSNSDGESWRVYDGASLTISAPASVEIIGVEFVTAKWNCSAVNTGSLRGKIWTATEENTSSVTFTMNGTSEILEMHISYKAVEAGVEGVEAEGAVIGANADGVVVSVAEPATAEIYNAAGQLVASEAVSGESVISVPAGFYIVRVGDATAKIVVR